MMRVNEGKAGRVKVLLGRLDHIQCRDDSQVDSCER
jgi:hypothetical protein